MFPAPLAPQGFLQIDLVEGAFFGPLSSRTCLYRHSAMAEHIVDDVPLHCRLRDIVRVRECLLGDQPRACAQWSRLRGRKCKLEDLLAKRSGLAVRLGSVSVPKRKGQTRTSTVEWKRYHEFSATTACGNACGAYCGARIQYLAEVNSA